MATIDSERRAQGLPRRLRPAVAAVSSSHADPPPQATAASYSIVIDSRPLDPAGPTLVAFRRWGG